MSILISQNAVENYVAETFGVSITLFNAYSSIQENYALINFIFSSFSHKWTKWNFAFLTDKNLCIIVIKIQDKKQAMTKDK